MTTAAKGDPKVLIEYIAKALVEAPDEVIVDVEQEGETTYVNLEVAESDMGRIIGRQGRTAKSLRAILNAAGVRHKTHYELDILD
ncbi:MAG TPA: KH domain-containing protein [Candidatus Koribacter sp.]